MNATTTCWCGNVQLVALRDGEFLRLNNGNVLHCSDTGSLSPYSGEAMNELTCSECGKRDRFYKVSPG